jgi:hypothetical protein
MHEGQAEDGGRREAFLAALQDGRSVTGAALAAGINRTLVYKWRGEMPDFAAAWSEAVETATDLIEEEALQRARHGVEKPIFYRGQQIGTVTTWNDKLLMFLLQRRRPMAPPARPKAEAKPRTPRWGEMVPDIEERYAAAMERLARDEAEKEARKAEAAAMEEPVPDEADPDDAADASPVFAPLDDEAPVPVRAAPPPVAPKRRPPWPSDLPDEWRDIPLTQLMRMTYLTSAQVMAVQSYGTPDPDAPTFPPPWDGSDRHLKWPVPRLRDRRA